MEIRYCIRSVVSVVSVSPEWLVLTLGNVKKGPSVWMRVSASITPSKEDLVLTKECWDEKGKSWIVLAAVFISPNYWAKRGIRARQIAFRKETESNLRWLYIPGGLIMQLGFLPEKIRLRDVQTIPESPDPILCSTVGWVNGTIIKGPMPE